MREKLKSVIKLIKLGVIWGGSGMFIAYHVRKTFKSIDKIVNPNVLDGEKKHTAEYIYIDDPAYNYKVTDLDKDLMHSNGLLRIWKSLKHSLAWRLLWLCRYGNKDQRNIALQQLASFKNNKTWDCLKLAQALDKNTAVLLARTKGADNRFFLPPPLHIRRAALTSDLLSFKFRDMITSIQMIYPHCCIQNFLCKYFANVQEQAIDTDSLPAKPDSISERDLCLQCLDAVNHHLSLFHNKDYDEDISSRTLVNMGLLPRLAELILRNPDDTEIDFAVLKILTILSIHTDLLQDFFQNGLIRELSRLLQSKDIRLASSAAVCLANLSGEYCYKHGLYLLHPLYRTTNPHSCDTLLVHGLRGGVFVTWRQRNKESATPIGIMEVTISDVDCNPCEEKNCNDAEEPPYIDPEIKQVIEDLKELDDESLLSKFDVVLNDIPIDAKREPPGMLYTAEKKRAGLLQEIQDQCSYTYCWPKDWLPKDCNNLRILGVNYWSSLSEWLEWCPLQTADIATRAAELAPNLIDAGVGKKDTPVVWLAHSMGGLIVKQVLTDAAQSSNDIFKKLCNNTKAVLFFSTPHKGSSLANMPRAAAAILWPSSDVRQLQENSPELLELDKQFIKLADVFGWETISFAESMPTLVTAFKVPVHFVEAYSADLGRGVFYQFPLDHLAICKPATRQSVLYTTVLDVIQRVTTTDIELRYSNPFVQWLMRIFWWLFKNQKEDVIENVEEPYSVDSLHWFDQMLLDTFTDF